MKESKESSGMNGSEFCGLWAIPAVSAICYKRLKPTIHGHWKVILKTPPVAQEYYHYHSLYSNKNFFRFLFALLSFPISEGINGMGLKIHLCFGSISFSSSFQRIPFFGCTRQNVTKVQVFIQSGRYSL
jgi:hypothetical protein